MNKHLPITKSTEDQGFTLIELMIVITIIAILSVVGISIYNNVQKNARDGVRKAEITSLGKSIETNRDPAVTNYTYLSTNYTADFPQNKPMDPLKSATGAFYCVATSTSTTPAMPPDATAAKWLGTEAGDCSTDAAATGYTAYSKLVDNTGAFQAGNNITAVKYWKICAKLEGTANPFCVSSAQP